MLAWALVVCYEKRTLVAGVAVGSVVAQYLVLNMLHVKPKRLQRSFLSCGCEVQVSDALNDDLTVLTFYLDGSLDVRFHKTVVDLGCF